MFKLDMIRDIKLGQQASRLGGGKSTSENDEIRILWPGFIHVGYFDEHLITVDHVKNHDDLEQIYRLRKIAEDGDIIMKLSSPYEACLINRPEEDYVIPSYCCIIRNFFSNKAPAIPNEYICAILNSDFAKKEISKRMKSSINNPMLKIADLKNLPIPDVSSIEMNRIGELFIHSTENRMNMAKLLHSEEMILNNLIYSRII